MTTYFSLVFFFPCPQGGRKVECAGEPKVKISIYLIVERYVINIHMNYMWVDKGG